MRYIIIKSFYFHLILYILQANIPVHKREDQTVYLNHHQSFEISLKIMKAFLNFQMNKSMCPMKLRQIQHKQKFFLLLIDQLIYLDSLELEKKDEWLVVKYYQLLYH